MWTDEHYGQKPIFSVAGLMLKLGAWTFSYGAEFLTDPAYQSVNLPVGDIVFTVDPAVDKFATLYVVPMKTISPEFPSGSNYYITQWSNDPVKAEMSNPPIEQWTPDISVVPCLNITIKAGATTLEVTANEFDLPAPPDSRRDVVSGGWRITAFIEGQHTAGYELLDAVKHASAFPVSLGKLENGEAWYAKETA